MTVVAGYGMVLCGNSDDVHHRYRGRIEKVKFGVPINEAFAHDIPATLLVLLLKVNKEGPLKKDIWRAPGNQAQVRKLSHIMQHGRLVNIANFSVYTAASVIKKFLSKLPGGIFGPENEQVLFNSTLNKADTEKQRQVFYRIFCSLPVPSQHLLVLLFGTFRMVSDSADSFGTKMTPDAIAISVAPSLFHSCIDDGRQAKIEDIQRFRLASQVVSSIITYFGHTDLFPRECYEFYARITGRTLRVDENWLFTFQYPSNLPSSTFSVMAAKCAGAYSLAALHLEPEPSSLVPSCSDQQRGIGVSCVQRTGSLNRHPLAHTADHPKRPQLSTALDVVDLKQSISLLSSWHPEVVVSCASAGDELDVQLPSTSVLRLSNRLSSSVGEVLHETSDVEDHLEMEARRPLTACAGETGRSLCCLDWVHENQARRMKSRSDWFLSPMHTPKKTMSVDLRYHSRGEWTAVDRKPLLEDEELSAPPTPKSAKQDRTPLGERQNSLKGEPALQRKKSGNSASAWVSGSSQQSPVQSIARRRSWKNRLNRPHLGDVKTHSLDSPNPPESVRLPFAAKSMSGDEWCVDVSSSDEVPKKRRSLKKKQSTQF